MMLRESQNHTPKYVRFTNGFPPKELVPSQAHYTSLNMHGGVFVGLHDEATSCLTKSHCTIPPLAKGRGNHYSKKHRASSSRYRSKTDPFDVHKGTEQVGFTPQIIKRSKPKLEKPSPRNEQKILNVSSQTTAGRKLTRKTSFPVTSFPNSDVPHVVLKPPEVTKNRILSDVGKEATLNELTGIDEVYQRVCNGNMESLCSLISPVKNKHKLKQVSSARYIQTSSQVFLQTKPSKPLHYTTTEKEVGCPNTNSQNLVDKLTRQRHSILVPLPYFSNPTRPPYTAPAQYKEIHNRPRIYASKPGKHGSGNFSSLSRWCSPSVINFDLPDISRPVTRTCEPTGSIIGVQNKSQTGKVAIVAAIDEPVTPPATAASELCQQQLFDADNGNYFEKHRMDGGSVTLGIESIHLEETDKNDVKVDQKVDKEDQMLTDTTIASTEVPAFPSKIMEKDIADRILAINLPVTLNVTDEKGDVNEVEIYDPEKRDLEKEAEVSLKIQKTRESQQKRIDDIETLLDEHEQLVQQVNELTSKIQK